MEAIMEKMYTMQKILDKYSTHYYCFLYGSKSMVIAKLIKVEEMSKFII